MNSESQGGSRRAEGTKRTWVVALTLLGAAGLMLLYALVDPAKSVWMPKCAFHTLTGWDCPGCGAQRMCHALLHGDLSAAWHANPFLLCSLPLLSLMGFAASRRTRLPRLYAVLNSPAAVIIATLLILVWTVLRNVTAPGLPHHP